MIRPIVIVIFQFFLCSSVLGQIEMKNFLSSQQVTNLRSTLSKSIEDTTRIRILIRLAKYHFESGNNEQLFLDSAALCIRNAKEINARLKDRNWDGIILLYEASLARRGGDRDSGKLLVNQAITVLHAVNDQFHLAEAYMELSRCHDPHDPQYTTVIKKIFDTVFQIVSNHINRDQQDSCISLLINSYILQFWKDGDEVKLDFLDRLIRSCRVRGDKIHEFWARKEIADIHYKQGRLTLAINESLQIAKEQKEGGYPRISFTYDLLSGLYSANADFNKALYYSLESIKFVSTALDSVYLGNFYDRISFNYSRTGSTSEALDWSLKSLEYGLQNMHIDNIYSRINDLTGYFIKLQRTSEALNLILTKRNIYPPRTNAEKSCMLLSLAKCYVALKKNVIAEKYCEELIALHDLQIKQKEITSDVILNQFLAAFYLNEGQYEKAEKYFKKTMDEWPKSSRDQSIQFQHFFLYKLDSARGNYLAAMGHSNKYHLIQDSIQTAAKIKQIEELKIAYQTEQKDSLISFKEQNIQLLTKQDQLQKSKLQQDKIIRNIGLAVVALLVIIMTLLYNRYRLKQRTNKKLKLQQSEIEKQNHSLNHLVNEKDWLLKEIHHRVKNNLQIVMSLLNSQSAYIDNETALTAIHDSQHRVHAMSLIHQKLYNTENLSSIDMSSYIRELVSYLSDSFDTGRRIRFELNIEPIQMDVSQAVPLGLILNEAITNSIKYAFPGNKIGTISISLLKANVDQYLLNISDNGVGIPAINKKTGSLGMNLMKGLSEDLDGNFSIENNNGTTIKISFIHEAGIKSPDQFTSSFVSSN